MSRSISCHWVASVSDMNYRFRIQIRLMTDCGGVEESRFFAALRMTNDGFEAHSIALWMHGTLRCELRRQ
jgi:hypothetical protein